MTSRSRTKFAVRGGPWLAAGSELRHKLV